LVPSPVTRHLEILLCEIVKKRKISKGGVGKNIQKMKKIA